nr:serine/threonine-protein kinase HT1-like [Ipomoea batatas]
MGGYCFNPFRLRLWKSKGLAIPPPSSARSHQQMSSSADMETMDKRSLFNRGTSCLWCPQQGFTEGFISKSCGLGKVRIPTHREENSRPRLEQAVQVQVASSPASNHPNICPGLTPSRLPLAVAEKNDRRLCSSCQPGVSAPYKRCWAANPSKRPDFTDIVSPRWRKSTSIYDLVNELPVGEESHLTRSSCSILGRQVACEGRVGGLKRRRKKWWFSLWLENSRKGRDKISQGFCLLGDSAAVMGAKIAAPWQEA